MGIVFGLFIGNQHLLGVKIKKTIPMCKSRHYNSNGNQKSGIFSQPTLFPAAARILSRGNKLKGLYLFNDSQLHIP